MRKYAMVINYGYCTNCHSCEVSCRNEKKIPLEEWGMKVVEVGPEKLGGKWEWDFVPVPSRLCDLCAERLDAGLVAPCQLHCLANVIEIVPIEELGAKMAAIPGGKVSSFIPR